MSNYTLVHCFCRSLQFLIILAEQFLFHYFSNELILEERPDI